MIRLDAGRVHVHVLTFRRGLLSAMGHDLRLTVTSLEVDLDLDLRAVEARLDPTSLRVVEALRDGTPLPDALSDADRRTIEDNVRRDVLESERFPAIRFVSTRVEESPGEVLVHGRLSLHGREREIALRLRRDADRYAGEITLHQPDWGIRPYSAFLGALAVRPDVVVCVSLPAEIGARPPEHG